MFPIPQSFVGKSVALLIFLPALYFVVTAVYNVYFHPLRKFPGPFWWRASRLPWAWHSWHGTLTKRVCELQLEYRDVLRACPDELHFFTSQAWNDIYGRRQQNGNGGLAKAVSITREETNGTPSIVNSSDEDHRRMRRLLSHAFSEKALTGQIALINSYIDLLINKLHHKAKGSGGSTTVDIVKWYNYTTFDILGHLAFGEPFKCLEDDSLHPWIKILFVSVKSGHYILTSKSLPQPWQTLVGMMIPRTGTDAHVEEYMFAVNKVKARIQAGEPKQVDFMSYILKHNDERGMSMPEIESNAVLLILAGSETTATFLSGLTYCLLTNPESYVKLRDIIRSTFPDEASITPQAVNQIDFFTACIEESFRMYPPAPHSGFPRITPPEGSVVDGKFVPGNTIVIIPQLPANRSDTNFADPTKYIPERWLRGDECPERYRDDDRKVMQPFSIGPRNCIGMNLAYLEVRMIFARMIWNFDFELMNDSRDWMDQKVFTLWEKKDLNVRLTPRRK